ncbi:NAD(P)H-dependent 6'-deoxychalcone synthase-like protein [Carex littledalei]|uniref:NAD(P)H-dependent 6'-deoxychalcone synthase-like protein n=1 Tax=Carex littledalei TaxID=544730 RepID=A0A833VZG6_9POAL|nr:NAD(P)H-dependent 6'-deoxychalcone synthase-like protein [Carex littledalei]
MTTSEMIPKLILNNGHVMPVVGMGTAEFPSIPEKMKSAYLDAIAIGYRHFDTASLYQTEQPLGEAIQEAIKLGLIGSREELFITSKLWCTENHPDLVLPSIQSSLRNLNTDYLDLYLIHLPMSVKPGASEFPIKREDVVPLDLKGVWQAMEECQRLGLTKSIGVSNFNTRKLEELLSFAKIPPAVDQVEMNTSWQQQKLKKYCANKGICITGYSPLGGQGGQKLVGINPVLTSDVLKEIADAKGKTIAQIALRWLVEQGVSMVVKSFNKERLRQNLEIFDWELTEEEREKIGKIPQKNRVSVDFMLAKEGSLNSIDISNIEIIEV